MMTTLFPGFLAAGVVFAALPVVLHLLSRRPPDRQPLPTARFLSEDQKTLLRLSSRPSDVPLMVARMLFALSLGAGFAGLTWTPERSGQAEIVLVDVEAAADIGVDSLLAAVRLATETAQAGGLQTQVVAYAADEDGALVTSAEPADLFAVVGEPRTTALEGLRALRSTMIAERALDSATVVWVVQPTWRQWAKGVGLLREAYWPGAVPLHPIGAPSPSPDDEPGVEAQPVVATLGFASEAPLHGALRALGSRPIAAEPGAVPEADRTFARSPSASDLEALILQARRGATVVLTGTLPTATADAGLPWIPDLARPTDAESAIRVADPGAPSPPRTILRAGRVPLPYSGAVAEGGPAAGARVIAVFDDARPAVASRPVGDGCIVYTAVSLTGGPLVRTPGYVDFVDDLSTTCSTASRNVALDDGATLTLARPDLPARVALADLDPASGTPLTPFLIMLALALLGTEVVLTRKARS